MKIKKKYIFFAVFVYLLLVFHLVFASDKNKIIQKSLREDLDGDTEKEYVFGYQFLPTKNRSSSSFVCICKRKEKKFEIQYQIATGDYLKEIECFDITKDNIADLIIKSASATDWSHLYIISFKNGKYLTLWDTASPVGLLLETEGEGSPQIKIGIPASKDRESEFYRSKPVWETWRWDGEKFVYTQGITKESRILELKNHPDKKK